MFYIPSTIILQKNNFIGTNFWEIMGLKSELVAEMRQNSEQFGCMYHDTNGEKYKKKKKPGTKVAA